MPIPPSSKILQLLGMLTKRKGRKQLDNNLFRRRVFSRIDAFEASIRFLSIFQFFSPPFSTSYI